MKLRAAIYVRVSTTEQATEGFSIKAQTKKLKSMADAKDYKVVKVYTDPGFSGAKLERPAIKELISDIETGSIDVVLVYKLDRLSRSQKNTLYLIEDVFLKNNVQFISMQESFDTSTSFGRAMIGILSVFAQLERDAITERTRMGAIERAKSGLYHGGAGPKSPTGYDFTDGKLIINESEAEIVRDIFDWYINGVGLNAITVKLKEKYPSRKILGTSTVGGILDNSLYVGKIKYAGETYEGQHTKIINEESFEIARSMRCNKNNTYKNQTKKTYMLTGLLRCGYCGARMATKGRVREYDHGLVFYYGCYSKRKSPAYMIKDPDCPSCNHRNTTIEDDVIAATKEIRFRYKQENNATTKNNEIDVMKKELLALESQLDKTIELYQVSAISMDKLNFKVAEINEKKDKLTTKISTIKKSKKSKKAQEDKIKKVESFDWENSDTAKKAIVLKSVIDEIIVYNDNFKIKWSM